MLVFKAFTASKLYISGTLHFITTNVGQKSADLKRYVELLIMLENCSKAPISWIATTCIMQKEALLGYDTGLYTNLLEYCHRGCIRELFLVV